MSNNIDALASISDLLQIEIDRLTKENAILRGERVMSSSADISLPAWFEASKNEANFISKLHVREWQDPAWRASPEGGWVGSDYVHSSRAGVRILDYHLFGPKPADSISDTEVAAIGGYSLLGVAHFTENAESHKGLCHGGSMCAIMDDAVGWLGFCASGEVKPWSGYTVQIDTSLKKPVQVGAVLRVEAAIVRREGRRKVFISARLTDPETSDVHCECKGIFLLPPPSDRQTTSGI